MLIFAQPSDLAGQPWNATPANAQTLLTYASLLVSKAVRASVYSIDPTTGIATDPLIVQALLEATCFQAAAWAANNIDPTLGLVPATAKSQVKIGTAQILYEGAAQAAEARVAMLTSLVPQARETLLLAGLLDLHIRESIFPYYLTPVQNPWFTP